MKKSIIAATMCAAIAASAVPFAGAANTVTATPTRDMGQTVYVNDTRVYPTGYNIANNNYFKLRDIGALVGFGVEWNSETQTVEISTERTAPSTAGIQDEAVNGAVAIPSGQRIAVDGIYVRMQAYQIGGNNYVKLRDIGLQADFGVGYDNTTGRVSIYPSLFYGEEPAETPATPDADTLDEYAQEVIRLTNEERAKAGLPALEVNDKLMQAAAIRAEEITEKFSHTRPNGTDASTICDEVGIELTARVIFAENIVKSTVLSSDIAANNMQAWMNSEGHRNQILRNDLSEIGVAYAIAPDGTVYGTQLFLGYE